MDKIELIPAPDLLIEQLPDCIELSIEDLAVTIGGDWEAPMVFIQESVVGPYE